MALTYNKLRQIDLFLKGNKEYGFTLDSTKNSNVSFLCILWRIKCCSFLPRCQLFMIQDTDGASQLDLMEYSTLKYRQSLNGMSITERKHSENPQHELSKALTGSRLRWEARGLHTGTVVLLLPQRSLHTTLQRGCQVSSAQLLPVLQLLCGSNRGLFPDERTESCLGTYTNLNRS